MTVIVGVVDQESNALHMGADSLATNGWHSAWDMREPKIFRVEKFLIGVCGSPRIAQLVKFKLALKDDRRVEDPFEFMCLNFVDRLRAILGENGARNTLNTVENIAEHSWLLVGFRGRLFSVDYSFAVVERGQPFDAIGCGSDFALGSLFETAGKDPLHRVDQALRCAEKFSSGVRGPFVVESLSDDQ